MSTPAKDPSRSASRPDLEKGPRVGAREPRVNRPPIMSGRAPSTALLKRRTRASSSRTPPPEGGRSSSSVQRDHAAADPSTETGALDAPTTPLPYHDRPTLIEPTSELVDVVPVTQPPTDTPSDDRRRARPRAGGDGLPPSRTPPQLGHGDLLARYIIERPLHEGVHGPRYRGLDPRTCAPVTIELLSDAHASDPNIRARFDREAAVLRCVRHEGVVELLDSGRLPDGRLFHVKASLEGTTLCALMRSCKPLVLQEALPILIELARALDTVHRAGIAHRRVEPGSVVLTERSGRIVPTLDRFEHAERITPGSSPTPPRDLSRDHTRYMAPEFYDGEPPGKPADVYAFGVVAYALLTGRHPFESDVSIDLVMQHIHERPRAPSARQPTLPEDVDVLLGWLLDKRPENRPELVEPIILALAHATGAPL